MDKDKIFTSLDDIKNEVRKMITTALLMGAIPGRLMDIEKRIDEIKASITEA
jgi:uncharacterized membrane protein YqgA involved in biofilm formation